MKPYDNPLPKYDMFYLNQCQAVHSHLLTHRKKLEDWDVVLPQFKGLACQIVSYFEDYIVEIGIWKAFIDTNKELYGYPLPFYALSDYDETYINVEDIAFLIWHFLTKYTEEEYIINPDHDVIMALANAIFDLFEEEMEAAPAIDVYDKLFTVKDNENYFSFKSKMKWFSTDSYLLGVELGPQLKLTQDEIIESVKESAIPIEYQGMFLYAEMEKYLYQKRSSYSALNGPEWFAKIAKCSDTRRQEILDLTYWIDGKFFLKERQPKHFIFEHILTNIQYKALIDSFQNNRNVRPSKTDAYVMHMIRWNEVYQLSGMMYSQPMTEKSIQEYKAERLTTPWILPEKSLEIMQKSTSEMYEAFIEFFKSPLMIFDSSAQLEKANVAYLDFHRQKRILENDNLTKESVQASIDAFKEKFGKNYDFKETLDEKGFNEGVGLFFIENVGTYIMDGVKPVIRDLKALTLPMQKTVDLYITFTNGYIPPLCTYLLAQYGSKNLKFPTDNNTIDVVKHLPFYWRMNSPEEFDRSYPMITLVDVKSLT